MKIVLALFLSAYALRVGYDLAWIFEKILGKLHGKHS